MPMTDQEAAERAVASFEHLSDDQETARAKIDRILRSDHPIVDVHGLLKLYNVLYFRSLLLPQVQLSWSSRLTSSAGTCELLRDPANHDQYTIIHLKLSEPLLKLRPRGDTINTLLHEAIHAYLFITMSWRHARDDNGSGHGPGFVRLADSINAHGGYEVTILHGFHDEADTYRVHTWRCDGLCRSQAPSFGLVKKVMNRPPGDWDVWWTKHQSECDGNFVKVRGPEENKSQLDRKSGLRKAGMQKNKLDSWVASTARSAMKRPGPTWNESGSSKRPRHLSECPICKAEISIELINAHLDDAHPAGRSAATISGLDRAHRNGSG